MHHTKKTKPLPTSPSQGRSKSLPLIRGIKGVCVTKSRHGFTLVELIVTITIIAILGVIAFTAFKGFESSARDSSRSSDLANLSQGLDTYYIKTGSYPNPDNAFTVTYSGGSLWYQGTVGDTLINTLSSNGSKLSKKPTDPLTTTKEYTYSKSAYGNTYELTSNWEGDSLAFNLPHPNPLHQWRGNGILSLLHEWRRAGDEVLIPTVYAASGNPLITYIKGNYNGMVAKTVTGSIIYVIATPSITTSTGTAGSNIDVTTLSGRLLYHGQTNSGGIAYTPTLIYFSGALPTNDTAGQITLFTTNLKTAYSGSVISYNSNIANILSTTGATNITSLGANIITNYLGGSASAPPPPPSTSYSLSNSLMFDSASSQYLNKTPGIAGNPNKWTWSGWVKRGILGSPQLLFSAATDGSNFEYFRFESTDELFYARYVGGAAQDTLTTVAKYRDPSAWLHVVVNRNGAVRTIYVNGVQVASGGSSAATGEIGQNKAHSVGRRQETASQYFDGYLADVNFVDSGALDPTAFGYTDPTTNQWLPKAYTGTYGTNGFRLNFASGANLGKDANGTNDWTPMGTPAPTQTLNQVIDTPLNNFATLNPLNRQLTGANNKGNLRVATTVNTNVFRVATFPIEHNAYFEISATANARFGLIWGQTIDDGTNWLNNSSSYFLLNSGGALTSVNSTVSQSLVPSWANGDIVSFIWNATDKTLTILRNNSQISVITVTNPSTTPPSLLVANITSSLTTDISVNFGQGGQVGLTNYSSAGGYFKYAPPSGFKALSTTNLPTPTIQNPKQYFDVLTYTGTSASQAITSLGFQPDLVWIKSRNMSYRNQLIDSIRGSTKALMSDSTDAESIYQNITAFNSNGFTLGTELGVNENLKSHVAWNWKAGGVAVANTQGTIASQVSANPTAGFSIVNYTGTGVNATVGHGLGVAPKMIIVKNRDDGTRPWAIYHAGVHATLPANYRLSFDTGAIVDDNTVWNYAKPVTDVFSVGTATWTNKLNLRHIAYVFTDVPGFSKFGSYTGNGSSDGPFVYTGFRPRYVMIKNATSAGGYNWEILDTKTSQYNPAQYRLYADNAIGEQASNQVDVLSNGFKVRIGDGSNWNTSGATYIYAAFAEAPFKYANAR